MPAPVDAFGSVSLLGGIVAAGDDRQRTLVSDLLSHLLAVVALVAADGQRRSRCIEQRLDGSAVMHLAAGDDEAQWPALAVNAGVDLGAAPAPTDADVLRLLPPFAPLAARCALTMVLSIRC